MAGAQVVPILMFEETPLEVASRAKERLSDALDALDQLGFFDAGAHAAMAIHALERRIGDLLASGAEAS